MTTTASSHTGRALFLAALLVVFSAFTADVLDLREELRFFSCPDGFLDSNVTTAILGTTSLDTAPVIARRTVDWESSVEISFLHLLPYSFRAPPRSLRS